MKRFNGNQQVDPGIYFDLRQLQFASISEPAALPGPADATWHRVPALAMLILAPILGLTFVIFLPFIGLAMVGWLLGRKAMQASGEAAHATVRVLRPSWTPAMAFLFRGKKTTAPTADAKAAQDEWLDDAKKRTSNSDSPRG